MITSSSQKFKNIFALKTSLSNALHFNDTNRDKTICKNTYNLYFFNI